MRYSVYNKELGSYQVYDGPPRSLRRVPRPTSMGAIPSESLGVLPPGSKYLGDSGVAQGEIVISSMGIKEFVLLIGAAIAARWIYERFFS